MICYLCAERPATDADHLGEPGDDGPVRGYLCRECNLRLGWVERIGLDTLTGYLTATPIGPPYRAVRRAQAQRHSRRHEATRNRVGCRAGRHLVDCATRGGTALCTRQRGT